MDKFSTLIASIALIISAYQSYLSWNARDDHLEAVAVERQLSVCAEIGMNAAEYAGAMDIVLAQAKTGRFSQTSFDSLKNLKPILQKNFFIGTYVLGDEFESDLKSLQSNGLDFVGAAFDASPEDTSKAEMHYDAFEKAGRAIQHRCKTQS